MELTNNRSREQLKKLIKTSNLNELFKSPSDIKYRASAKREFSLKKQVVVRKSLKTDPVPDLSSLKQDFFRSIAIDQSDLPFELPTNLNELKKRLDPSDLLILSSELNQAKTFPSFRGSASQSKLSSKPMQLEADFLEKWMDKMLSSIPENNENFEDLQVVYCTCLKEIVRQVNIFSPKLSSLLQRVFYNYFHVLVKVCESLNSKSQKLKRKYKRRITEIGNTHIIRSEALLDNLEAEKKQSEGLAKEKAVLHELNENLHKKLYFLKSRVRTFQEQYEKTRAKLVRLEDDHGFLEQIVSRVLRDVEGDYYERKLSDNKIIRFRDLSKAVMNDPILRKLNKLTSEDKETFELALEKLDEDNKKFLEAIHETIEETKEEFRSIAVGTDFASNSRSVESQTVLHKDPS